MRRMSVILVVILSVVIGLIYSSYPFSISWVSAEPSGPITCERTGTVTETCCQEHIINRSPDNPAGTLVKYCTDCTIGPGGGFSSFYDCSERYIDISAEQPPTPSLPTPPIAGENIIPGVTGVLEQPPTFSPFGPSAPLQGGVLEQPLADQGTIELPPATEGSQPATAEEEQPVVPACQEGLEFNEDLSFCVPTDCPEGQELNEETGICVLEEQSVEQQEQAAEEPEEQQQPTEDEQPPEESGSEEENGNN